MSRRIVLGTAGHIDHGKTALIKALTGVDTDRLKEEKRRGITIELGFTHLALNGGLQIGVVDVPGHERFVRTMVAGASGIDLVALVIAADEGVMPQTREHVDICDILGVKAGVVVLTKVDVVDEEWLDLVTEDVKEYVATTFLKNAPLVPVSAVTGQGLDEFKAVVASLCVQLEERRDSGPFRLCVDRVFSRRGFGTVVTGTALSGQIQVGQAVTVYPEALKAKVRGLQVHGQEVEKAASGTRTAINLQGLNRQDISRGDVVASPGAIFPSRRLDAWVRLLNTAPRELKNRVEVHLHVGTTEAMARIILLEAETLKPGSAGLVQLILADEIACLPGDHFVLRALSPLVTIGGGEVVSVRPPRRKRFDPEALAALRTLKEGQPVDKVAALVRQSRLLGLSRAELAASTALTEMELDRLLHEVFSQKILIRYDKEAQKLVHVDSLGPLEEAVIGFLKEYHRQNPLKPGAPKEELKTRIKLHADPKLIIFVMAKLIQDHTLRAEEELVALASHRVALASEMGALKEKILQAFRRGGLAPPRFKDLEVEFKDSQAKDVLALLLKEGLLVKARDDMIFEAQILDELEARLIEFLKSRGEMSTQDFKDLTGVSRKYLIPLAEHFDHKGVTIRVGEVRRLREKLA